MTGIDWKFWTTPTAADPFKPTPKQQEKIDAGLALTRVLGDRVYAGTVSASVKARRRAANRVARASRRINRLAA